MNNSSNSNSNINNNSKENNNLANKGLNTNNGKETSRQKVDNALDGTGSEALQKMGVSKGLADKAIKKNGGTFSPGNLPAQKLSKNISRNKLAKGLDKMDGNGNNGAPSRPIGENYGRKALNNMKGTSKPEENGQDEKNKKLDKAINVAKHLPLPHVKAAAQAADKIKKSGLSNSLLSRKKGGIFGNNENSKNNGSIDIKAIINNRKIIMYSIPILFLIIITAAIVSSVTTSASESSQELNTGTCMLEDDKASDKCDAESEEAKEFYERVKEVKKEYEENGKKFNAVYIAGFYSVVSNESDATNIEYDEMTKEKIEEIANAMFKEEDGIYTFDEDTFKENLIKKILPGYIPNKSNKEYENIVGKIFDYVERFKKAYGLEEEEEEYAATDSDYANRLVQVAKEQLKPSNPDRNKPYGNKYQRMFGSNSIAWCAAFVSWCANQAGIPKTVIPHYTAVNSFYDYYVTYKHGIWHSANSGYKPKPGDLVIWHNYKNAANMSHIGIVEKYQNGMVTTIEGNTGYDPTARVGTHTVSIANLKCNGFVTPKYPAITTVLKGKNTDQKVWNFFISKKVTKETTAAIMGNLYQESGIDPNKYQYGGPGRGIAQWEEGSGRYNNLVNMAKKRNKSWNSLDVQLDYLWYELSGAEATCKLKMDRYYGGFNHFIKAKDIDWAVEAFEYSFERAGKPMMESRKSYARSYFQKYGGK